MNKYYFNLAKLMGWEHHYEIYGLGYARIVWRHPALPRWRFCYDLTAPGA